MNKKYRSIALAGLFGASTLTFAGCGGSNSPSNQASTEPNTTATATTPASETASLQPKVSDSNNSAQQQTVAVFLDSLRRGDETTANSMLTARAQSELQKTDYVIQPLGTPDGEYKIGRLVTYQEDPTVALVESQWREPATKTDPELTMDIVCEVHQEANGWRISGMAVTVAGEPEPLVIDFENGQRLQQQLRMANGQPTAPASAAQGVPQNMPQLNQQQLGQQPAQGFQPQGFQPDGGLNNLPALPAFPTGAENQIANPPGTNVLR